MEAHRAYDGLAGQTTFVSLLYGGTKRVAVDRSAEEGAWRDVFVVLAVFAEQNPSCFTATWRAELEAAYRKLQLG